LLRRLGGNGMQIHFLGSGGYRANERRHTMCVMLPEAGVVFDAGTGAFRVAERVVTDELHLFLSHAHLDHIVGLSYFLVPLMQGRIRKMFLHTAPEYFEAVKT